MVVKETWPPKKTMVCVTVQKTCERLIREGAKYAGDEGLNIVHVVREGDAVLGGRSDGDALEYLFRIARSYNAEMEMLRSNDVIGTLVEYAKRNDIAYLVLGTARDKKGANVGEQLEEKLPGVRVIAVS